MISGIDESVLVYLGVPFVSGAPLRFVMPSKTILRKCLPETLQNVS